MFDSSVPAGPGGLPFLASVLLMIFLFIDILRVQSRLGFRIWTMEVAAREEAIRDGYRSKYGADWLRRYESDRLAGYSLEDAICTIRGIRRYSAHSFGWCSAEGALHDIREKIWDGHFRGSGQAW